MRALVLVAGLSAFVLPQSPHAGIGPSIEKPIAWNGGADLVRGQGKVYSRFPCMYERIDKAYTEVDYAKENLELNSPFVWKAEGQANDGEFRLPASEFRRLLGGDRSPALFNKIVSAQTMLLSGVIAGVSAAFAFPARKPVNYVWLAIASAGVISGAYFLIANLTGKLWVFGV